MRLPRWQYAMAILIVSVGVAGCAVERGEVYSKDGKQYGAVSGIWRDKWWQHYERGVSYAAGGYWDEAIASLKGAVSATPGQQDRLRVNTYGVHFLEGYFPHRELGVVYYHLGRYAEAEHELVQSLGTVDTSKAKFYLNKTRKILLQQSDRTPPRIALKSPADGLLTQHFTVELQGQVSDDTSVASLTINGQPLFIELAEPQYSFAHQVTLQDGPNPIDIVATDLLGRQSHKSLTVFLDRHGPLVSVEQVVLLEGTGRAHLQGFVSDHSHLARFVIAGRHASLQPGNASNFDEEIPVAPGMTALPFEAEDAAGNITRGEITLAVPGHRTRHGSVGDLPRWASLFPDTVLVDARPSLRLAQPIDHDKPVIMLRSPEDRAIVYDNSIFLEGKVTDASNITAFTIEGTSLWRRKSQQIFFAYVAPLRLQRDNGFLLEAVDEQGNRAEREIIVTHKVQPARQLSARLRVALTPFAEKCQPGRLSATVYDRLFSALIARQRFHLQRGENPEGVEGVVRGTVCEENRPEAPRTLEVFARFFDVSDKQNEEAQVEENVYGEDLTAPEDVQTLMAGLALKLQRHFPLQEGYITDKEGQQVWLNLSKNNGLRPRMKLLVFRETEKQHEQSHTLLGEARVQDVSSNASVAQLLPLAAWQEVRKLDKVITK